MNQNHTYKPIKVITVPPQVLFVVQNISSAIVVIYAIVESIVPFTGRGYLSIFVWLILFAICAATAIVISSVAVEETHRGQRRIAGSRYELWFKFFVCLASTSWLYILATEIVGVLAALGLVLHASKTMIGFTLLSFGALHGGKCWHYLGEQLNRNLSFFLRFCCKSYLGIVWIFKRCRSQCLR